MKPCSLVGGNRVSKECIVTIFTSLKIEVVCSSELSVPPTRLYDSIRENAYFIYLIAYRINVKDSKGMETRNNYGDNNDSPARFVSEYTN
jgi:hypothetical protein